MSRLTALACGAALLFAAGCASGESFVKPGFDFGTVDRVAVVEVAGDVHGEGARNQVADFFATELLIRGYGPVERAQVAVILEEQEFQRSELTTSEGAARAGRILNVDAAMIINVVTEGESLAMTAKMLDVEDGSLLWSGFGTGSTGRTLGTIAGAAVGGAAGAALGGDTAGTIAGGLTGAVLGGVTGRALSPQEQVLVRKVARKVCRELPYRMPVSE
jgi:hypothetical protein